MCVEKMGYKFMNKNDNDFWIAYAVGAVVGLAILLLIKLL